VLEDGTLVFRIVLIGDSSVGKTCIVNRFLHDMFNAGEQNTIGSSCETYAEMRDGFRMELQIWDTAGQEKFRSLGPIYYREAAALVVYDVANRSSLASVQQWIDGFHAAAGRDAIVIVVGNKIGLLDSGSFTDTEGRKFCESRGYDFLLASAKTGAGVAEVFAKLLDNLAERRDSHSTRGVQRYVMPPRHPPDVKSKCC
jgi:small GTP-binding protein